MLTILTESVNSDCFRDFFHGLNPLPEFQTPIPGDRGRHGQPKYEDRLSSYLQSHCIHSPGVIGQSHLNGRNTIPSIPAPAIIPDIVRIDQNSNHNVIQYLTWMGKRIKDFVEFGHNYISQPHWYPANKLLMDFAKVMGKLQSVQCHGLFYHVIAISDPIGVCPDANHLIKLYGITEYTANRNNLANLWIKQIYDEIERIVSGVNPQLQIIRIPIDWPVINPRLKTHFIILGPLFIEDRHQIWDNANQSLVFNRYEIHSPTHTGYRNFYL